MNELRYRFTTFNSRSGFKNEWMFKLYIGSVYRYLIQIHVCSIITEPWENEMLVVVLARKNVAAMKTGARHLLRSVGVLSPSTGTQFFPSAFANDSHYSIFLSEPNFLFNLKLINVFWRKINASLKLMYFWASKLTF